MIDSVRVACKLAARLTVLSLTAGQLFFAAAQSLPTAQLPVEVSTFAGASETFTGLDSGKNTAITAGLDIETLRILGFDPKLEFRGTRHVTTGTVDAQDNLLGGIQLGRSVGRLRLYADILAGRGEINYLNGYQVPNTPIFYTQSHSIVISPGCGVDFDLTRRFSLRLDGQFQRYGTPVTASRFLYAKQGTVAVVYHIRFRSMTRIAP